MAQSASVEQGEAPSYMVVDMQQVLQDSKAVVSVKAQIDKRRASIQDEVSKLEAELRTSEKSLQDARPTLSQDEFEARRKAFEQRVSQVQAIVQDRRQSLEKAYSDAMNDIRKQLLEIIAKTAEKDGIALVLSKQQVIMVDRKYEKTGEILATLDAQLPDYKVQITP
ncbi:OmpH family outer membrane protein [Radicibacter daui]|uniref:OmpH family outer membrane protein n=1 Tax=Radicibacter daui TaxID=3064829 RepID=UPI004046F605